MRNHRLARVVKPQRASSRELDDLSLEDVAHSAHALVERGDVWGYADELQEAGQIVDDDVRAVLNAVVARRVSDIRHDVMAKCYTKKGFRAKGE